MANNKEQLSGQGPNHPRTRGWYKKQKARLNRRRAKKDPAEAPRKQDYNGRAD